MKKFICFYLIFSLIFMGVVTWDMLAKNQTDPETIEEAVNRLIDDHLADSAAHLDAGASLESHKTDSVVDHPAESVVNDKILYMARAYSFIVDSAGEGDYTTIQAAIDAANALGGGRIFIKNGTYAQDANLVLYDNIELIGEDDDNAIIDFSGTAYGITITGTSGTHKKNIKISGLCIKGSDTPNQNIYATYVDNLQIFDCYIIDAYNIDEEDGMGVRLYYCYYSSVKNCRFDHNLYTIYFDHCQHCVCENCDINDSGYEALTFIYGQACRALYNYFTACSNTIIACFYCSGRTLVVGNVSYTDCESGLVVMYSTDVIISNNDIMAIDTGTTDADLYIRDCNRLIITSNTFSGGGKHGIYIFDDTNRCIIANNQINNNAAWGIAIINANCNKNLIIGNIVYNNSSGAISDSGTSTVSEHNITS